MGNDVAELHPALVVGKQQHRLEQHRLVGVAHVHLPHHVQKQVLAVGVVDECPAVLLGIFLQGFLFEILKGSVFDHGYHQIGYQQTVPDIPLDGLRLYVHPAAELHLGDHAGGFLLPVEDVHQLIVQGIHQPPVNDGLQALAPVIEALFGGLLLLGAQHQGAGLVLLQSEQLVHGVEYLRYSGTGQPIPSII